MLSMTKVQLKNKLIEKIESIEDLALIEELLGLVSIETNNIYNLNSEQTTLIHKAQKQIDNGEFITNENLNKEIDEWLEK